MRKPYRRTSGTKIALISIILIAVSWFIFMLIYFDVEKDINYIPFLIITGIIIFALIVILQIIKIDSVKAIRNSEIVNSESGKDFKPLLPIINGSQETLIEEINDIDKKPKG